MSQLATDRISGLGSYVTGGYAITTGLASVDHASIVLEDRGNLGGYHPEYVRNSPSAGQVTVKIIRNNYDKLTSVGAVTGLPSGVTARATSGGTYDTDVAHIHGLTHDHAISTSGTNSNDGGGTVADLTAPVSIGSHTHDFDPPSFTGNSGTSAHNHQMNNIYDHAQSVSQTATDASQTELANGTDLSGATINWVAVDE